MTIAVEATFDDDERLSVSMMMMSWVVGLSSFHMCSNRQDRIWSMPVVVAWSSDAAHMKKEETSNLANVM
jgi:hypothetical protein